MPPSLCPQEAELLHSFPLPCSFQPLSLGSQLLGEGYQTLLPPLDQLASASCLLPSALLLFLCWERRKPPILHFWSLTWLFKIQAQN